MKINDSLRNISNPPGAKPASVETNSPSSVGSSSAPSAAQITTLSSQLTTLQSLQSNLASTPMFDAKKVDAIRMEIESGQFSVDSGKVADGMIKDAVSFAKAK